MDHLMKNKNKEAIQNIMLKNSTYTVYTYITGEINSLY